MDAIPCCVVKEGGGYMVIALPKLKFLDITNYLAMGTSLEKIVQLLQRIKPKGNVSLPVV